MVRQNHSGAFDAGGPVPAEHINVFPTGPVTAVGVHPTNRPCITLAILGTPRRIAPHRVGAAAMPGPCRIGNSGDASTRAHAM